MGWWDAIIKSKDPSSVLVVFEDGAAVAGLIIVMILMGISHTLQIPELDGLASVLVGCLLVFVSLILARESRSLLMGEGIAPETRQRIEDTYSNMIDLMGSMKKISLNFKLYLSLVNLLQATVFFAFLVSRKLQLNR